MTAVLPSRTGLPAHPTTRERPTGGRLIDQSAWTAHETFDGPSLWGHERLHLPDEPRARLRDMRLDAAARGVRAPVEIDCPWLSSIVRTSNREVPTCRTP